MWNGTAEILKQKPMASRPIDSRASVCGVPAGCDDRATPSCSSRVDPDSANANAIP